MIIKVYYAGGRIDVFDTDRMTDGIPQPGNMLTNYALDLSDVNGESLWLCSYYYEAAQAYKGETGPKGLPVARRRDGWSFLIADAEDMHRLNRVTMDGETVLIQIEGELVDAAGLSWAYDSVEEYGPKIMLVYKQQIRHQDVNEYADGTFAGIPSFVIAQLCNSLDNDSSSARF